MVLGFAGNEKIKRVLRRNVQLLVSELISNAGKGKSVPADLYTRQLESCTAQGAMCVENR
jgi:hypothetical protein